jgi:copper oxidase (laccase) domain-containing protein
VARIAEIGVAAMTKEFGSRPEELIAAIGPAIRTCCFAVGEEVRQRFADEFVYADDLFVEEQGQLYADLHSANHRQLVGAGLRAEAITTVAECSACARTLDGRRRYFSHRAEKGFTGRMLSVAGAAE